MRSLGLLEAGLLANLSLGWYYLSICAYGLQSPCVHLSAVGLETSPSLCSKQVYAFPQWQPSTRTLVLMGTSVFN